MGFAMFHFCPRYSSSLLSLLCFGRKELNGHRRFAISLQTQPQKSRLSEPQRCWHRGKHADSSAQQPCYCRVSYCSFSCPFAQILSLSTASKKLFRHMFMLCKTHTQLQDSPTTVMNWRYQGTSPLRSYSNIAREKKTLGRRITGDCCLGDTLELREAESHFSK